MPKVKDFIDEANGLIIQYAIAKLYSNATTGELETYIEINDSTAQGVINWNVHHVTMLDEYVDGNDHIFHIELDYENVQEMKVPSWVFNAKVKNWKHAKNLFVKYAKKVVK